MSKELLAFLDKLHDRSVALLQEVTFDKQLEEDGYIICLYASMIELAGGIIVLVKENRHTSVSPTFRTFLEAYADFKNILDNANYIKNCYARHHERWLKIHKESEKPNPFLEKIRDHEDRDAAIDRHKTALNGLSERGYKPLNALTRFERAGMADAYRSIYHFESDRVHNNLQALISRHIDCDQNDFSLALYKNQSIEDYLVYLDTTARLLMDATQKVHERLKSASLCQREVVALSEELAGLETGS
jgi:Family of unknown function (DUF5677)